MSAYSDNLSAKVKAIVVNQARAAPNLLNANGSIKTAEQIVEAISIDPRYRSVSIKGQSD